MNGLTAQQVAEAFESATDVRPECTDYDDRIVVGDPLPVEVTILPTPFDRQFLVRCTHEVDGGVDATALMTVNMMNLSDACAARLYFVGEPSSGRLVAEVIVCGPILAKRDFPAAVHLALEAGSDFAGRLTAMRSTHDAVRRMDEMLSSVREETTPFGLVPPAAVDAVELSGGNRPSAPVCAGYL